MLRSLREYAFRASLDVPRHVNRTLSKGTADNTTLHWQAGWSQLVPMNTTSERTVYGTDWAFAAVAAAASVMGAAAVLPLYYGCWTLGRRVSLNPLEIAKAFGAPLLDDVGGGGGGSNGDGGRAAADAEAAQLVRRVGAKRVRYTVVEEVLSDRDESEDGGASRNEVSRLCFVVDMER